MRVTNLLIALFALFAVSCGKKNESEQAQMRPVKVITIESTSEFQKKFSGVVEAINLTNLAFRVSGQIINFPVSEGQMVKKGDLIAELDTRELDLVYSADKAAFETAQAQYERAKRLVAKEAISMQEFEVNKASYERSKSAFENSKNNIRDAKLYAPFAGVIQETLVENFQRVSQGNTIVKLVNPNNLQINFTIPDNHLYFLQNNPSYTVSFDIIKGKKFKARLHNYTEISSDGSGIPVSLVIDDPSFKEVDVVIKPGFACNVEMNIQTQNILGKNLITIPLTAVFSDKNNAKNVWVVTANEVKQRQIVTGKLIGDDAIVVESGLSDGEVIVVAGVTQLKEGDKVTLTN